MLLNQTAEYALRAMACLAQEHSGFMSSRALAGDASIPPHYVSKVMRQLVVAGLVEARRGRKGGFSLAHEPNKITYADILNAVGGQPNTERCAFGHSKCDVHNPCPLHPTWAKLQVSFETWATTTTLSDVITDKAAIRPR